MIHIFRFYYDYLIQWIVCMFNWNSQWPLLDIICLFRALLWSPVHSCVFLCVPMSLLCIQIGLCWALFANCVQSCASNMALNKPLSDIFQSVHYQLTKLAFVGHSLVLLVHYVQIAVSLSEIFCSLESALVGR